MGSNPALGQLGSKRQFLWLFTVTICVYRAPEIPSSTFPLLFSFVLDQKMCPGCEQSGRDHVLVDWQGATVCCMAVPRSKSNGNHTILLLSCYLPHFLVLTFELWRIG